jgi:hypothetical protein
MADIYAGFVDFEGEFDLQDPTLFPSQAEAPYFQAFITVPQGPPTPDNRFRIVSGVQWDAPGGTLESGSFAQSHCQR